MFFKRSQPDANANRPGASKNAKLNDDALAKLDAPAKPLAVSELRRTVDPATLKFTTTAELEPISGLIGQDRALKAIQFGANMRSNDFNVFVLGPPASGKSTAVKQYLSRKAREEAPPADWVYVNNFENPNRPRAIRLPSGRARPLAKAMIGVIDELRSTIPATFEGEDYQARRRSIEEEFRSGQEEAFEALNKRAMEQNIAIVRTPTGFVMAPTHEGKIVKPEVFNTLPEVMRKEVETRIESLQKELEQILERVPKSDKQRRQRVSDLNTEVATVVVRDALDDVEAAFASEPEVKSYLEAAGNDLVRNVALFLIQTGEESEIVKQPADTARDPRFRRYMVNVVVGNGDLPGEGAPIHEELNPTYGNVVGRVEHIAQMGALVTDFLLIKPGALHQANGGYLLIDARKLLLSPFAWEALKRALKSREIRIEQPSEVSGLISTQTLDPEPIPLELKVVLFGDRELYYLLSMYDPDFAGLFKVQADFDDSIDRSADNDHAYARLIASIVRDHNLKPANASAVARLIEGARLADDREKLSIQIGHLADIIREANYWASDAGSTEITREAVVRAVGNIPSALIACVTARRRPSSARSSWSTPMALLSGRSTVSLSFSLGISHSAVQAALRRASAWARVASPTSSARPSSVAPSIRRA
jgi:predicted ATP-dependent protease